MRKNAIGSELIEPRILQARGHRVMLDADLAQLYGVPTKVLLQAVKRNLERFPRDFMFQLTEQEVTNLRSQIVTSSSTRRESWGGRRTLPYVFSEQGVAMLSSVLRSARAIAANIAIMRAFVRLRELALVNTELAKKLDELERRVSAQGGTSPASSAPYGNWRPRRKASRKGRSGSFPVLKRGDRHGDLRRGNRSRLYLPQRMRHGFDAGQSDAGQDG